MTVTRPSRPSSAPSLCVSGRGSSSGFSARNCVTNTLLPSAVIAIPWGFDADARDGVGHLVASRVDHRDGARRLVGDVKITAVRCERTSERFGAHLDGVDDLFAERADHGHRAAGHVGHIGLLVVWRNRNTPRLLADRDLGDLRICVARHPEYGHRVVVRVDAPHELVVVRDGDRTRSRRQGFLLLWRRRCRPAAGPFCRAHQKWGGENRRSHNAYEKPSFLHTPSLPVFSGALACCRRRTQTTYSSRQHLSAQRILCLCTLRERVRPVSKQ